MMEGGTHTKAFNLYKGSFFYNHCHEDNHTTLSKTFSLEVFAKWNFLLIVPNLKVVDLFWITSQIIYKNRGKKIFDTKPCDIVPTDKIVINVKNLSVSLSFTLVKNKKI